MTQMSRRRFIGAGAALGAAAYLPGWSWAGAQSVAGIGGSTSPWYVWDEDADPVIAAVIDRGEVASVNALLRGWTKNGQAVPDGLPADLRDFIEHARQLPAWADTAKLTANVDFDKKRGTYLGVAYGFVSGMMSTVIPHEAHAVYYSKGGADMKRRISRTAKFGYDIGSIYGFHDPRGEMAVTAVKTRMGGWKTSGLGARNGPEGIRKYCRQQLVGVTKVAPASELYHFPLDEKRSAMLERVLVAMQRPAGRAVSQALSLVARTPAPRAAALLTGLDRRRRNLTRV